MPLESEYQAHPMPLFHTNLFSNDPPGDAFGSRGAAWTFEKQTGACPNSAQERQQLSMQLFHERGHAVSTNHYPDGMVFFDMEIQIRAGTSSKAQHAYNLLVASIDALDGSIAFSPEPFGTELAEVGAPRSKNEAYSRTGLLSACALANRASRRRPLAYALHKLALSYRSCSPHIMDLDPSNYPRLFGVEHDPI